MLRNRVFCYFIKKQKRHISLKYSALPNFEVLLCDPAGARTQDPNIKSVVLYQLSYGIPQNESAKIKLFFEFHKSIDAKSSKI